MTLLFPSLREPNASEGRVVSSIREKGRMGAVSITQEWLVISSCLVSGRKEVNGLLRFYLCSPSSEKGPRVT